MRILRRGKLIIKLLKRGSKKFPSYDICLTRKRVRPYGVIAKLGFITTAKAGYQICCIDFHRFQYWLAKGVVVAPPVYSFILSKPVHRAFIGNHD